ncbi:HAD-IC family P-type ATPase [Salmonella enterica]|nr:HAD-IC family P-type ATPase [Salmonella enterica]EIT2872115.1 HAD-IC family P-type ATPase [Salmonella enterica]EIT2899063.1 HAD-IC family P-type ATPase [Salmonella enterica]HDC1187376.1 HAD-IC family P-type ATPase [Salmonella enterica]
MSTPDTDGKKVPPFTSFRLAPAIQKADSCCCEEHCASSAPVSTAVAGTRYTWKISGMDCAACARKVENAVRQIRGVNQAQVLFATEKLVVDADTDLRAQIEHAVQKAGYTLRSEDSRDAIRELHQLGVNGVILTGDNPRAAAAIAGELDLAFKAGLLPEDKVRAVTALNQQAPLAMVGDGINDAPAMKAASIGIAMGSGTDVALETADAALTHNRLRGLAQMITLARATHANIRQNITIALGLKAIFLVTTLLGFTGLWLAILADTGATVLVTANALRLLRKN